MATGTRPGGKVDRDNVPEGLKVFTVIDRTIKDSEDHYCEAGEDALLDEKLARHYYRMDMIRVDFPDFNADDPTVAEPVPQPVLGFTQAEMDAAVAAAVANALAQATAEKTEAVDDEDAAVIAAALTTVTAVGTTANEDEVDAAGKPGESAGGKAEVTAGTNRRQVKP
jgi:hypothetical protein